MNRRALILVPVALLLLLAWMARGRTARVLIFSGLALVVALAPILPLTISISTTESERFVYLPTVFSCIFFVWAIRAVLRRRALAVAACAARDRRARGRADDGQHVDGKSPAP